MPPPANPDAAALETLRLIGPDPQNWVPDHPGIDHNVVLVGGGQTGSALAFALRRAGIGKVSVIDAAPDEARAGIWLNAARMNLLRTPKSLVGPEVGLPTLSFQAWYEARHDAEAYKAIDRIPRKDWAAYLNWYRQFLDIPVRYDTRLTRIEPATAGFRLHLLAANEPRVETIRKIVLCTGFDGMGRPFIPAVLTDNLPATVYVHTENRIDFAALAGKTVAVIGAAASAFDAAGVALEHGAAAVHLFARRPEIAALPVARARGFPGAYDNYPHLPDAIRWHQAIRFRRAGSTPTTDAIERTVRYPHFYLHLDAPWQDARMEDGRIAATAGGATHRFDFVIAGTGYAADLAARPELGDIAPHVLLWRERFTPPPGEEDAEVGAHPYLGFGHEYLEKIPGTAPWLKDIHVQNPSGFVSFGVPTGDVPSMKRDVPAIVARVSQDLLLADLPAHEERMRRSVPPDFTRDLYAAAVR
jgi:cation diffusion facilitator CzcD-associated flavoprotein CzcO